MTEKDCDLEENQKEFSSEDEEGKDFRFSGMNSPVNGHREVEKEILPLDVQISEVSEDIPLKAECGSEPDFLSKESNQYFENKDSETDLVGIKVEPLEESYEDRINEFLSLVNYKHETEKNTTEGEEEEKPKCSVKTRRKKKCNSLKCPKCGAMFKYQSTFDYHKKSKCGSSVITETNKLVKMSSKNKKGNFTCNECNKELGSRTSLMVHLRLHNGERPFSCDICQRTFTQKVHMKDHMKTHDGKHPSKPLVFICAECGEVCSTKKQLRTHTQIHFGDKVYECDICHKRFRTPSNMSNHKIVHSDKKDFACFICGKEFFRKVSLEEHMRVHTKEKPFSCDICGKAFSDKNRRNTHFKRHTGELTKQCEECGMKFASSYDVRIHARKHTGEKPFACNVCGRMFSRKAIMETHLTLHTGRKDYKCVHCGEAFNRKSKLDIHEATHSGEFFSCSICKKVFKCKSYLIPHMKVHMGTGRKRIKRKSPNRQILLPDSIPSDFCKPIFMQPAEDTPSTVENKSVNEDKFSTMQPEVTILSKDPLTNLKCFGGIEYQDDLSNNNQNNNNEITSSNKLENTPASFIIPEPVFVKVENC